MKNQKKIIVKDFCNFIIKNTIITVCSLNGVHKDHILCEDDYTKEVVVFVPTGELKANLIVNDSI